MKSKSFIHFMSIITFGFLIFLILCTSSVIAIKITGSLYSGSVAQGGIAVHTMTVSIQPTEPPMDLMVDVWGFGQTSEQSFQSLSPELDTSPYSARAFINVEPKTFHLNPGESKEVVATITLPSNPGDGGRYAMITVHNAPVGNGTTAVVTAVSVPVLVTIKNSAIKQTGTITKVTVGDVIPGQPVRITTQLKNTGNSHYIPKINVTVTDPSGKIVADVAPDATPRTIIPTFTVNYDATLRKDFPPGTYTVTSKISLEDGKVLDTKNSSFVVEANYIPPLQGANIRITANNGGILATPDKRVSISIPAGAVFSDTDVTLKPLAQDQLPKPSADMTLASTAFSVEGITGLLAKDATLTVKYTSADLEAAKSDVTKLSITRYDNSNNNWTVLPTTLDKNALTLSAATNRFGTMALMVTSQGNTVGNAATGGTGSTSGKPGIALNPIIAFAALGLTIAFVGYRIRK